MIRAFKPVLVSAAASLLSCVSGPPAGTASTEIDTPPRPPGAVLLRGPTAGDSTRIIVLDTSAAPTFVDAAPASGAHGGCTERLTGRTGTWIPGADVVLPADTALLAILDSALGGNRQYHRRYLGVVIGDRRLLFVSGLSRALDGWLANSGLLNTRELFLDDFHMHGPVPADAGIGLWSILYDPVTDRFGRIHVSCSLAGNAGPVWDGKPLPP